MSSNNDDVGYKKPPKGRQFKKGVSGNPSGRPKGPSEMILILQEILNRPVTYRKDGEEVTVYAKQILLESLFSRAVKGDYRAAELLFKITNTGDKFFYF